MLVTLSGIVIDLRFVIPENAFSLIVVVPLLTA